MMAAARTRRAGVWAAVMAAVVLTGLSAPARADDRTEARAHYDKATTAYALGHFADAAAEFEQAFTLKSDPALLYNAAQAYRLAGNRERALQLYRNYIRVYGRRAEHAPDVEWHITELEKALPARPAGTVEPASVTTAAPPAPAAPAAPSVTAAQLAAPPPAASLVEQPAAPGAATPRPIYERWWFWTGVGAVVVTAAVVGVVLATRRSADCGVGVDYCANTGL
jgi:tetratricopeptide (TPR) repeat protein